MAFATLFLALSLHAGAGEPALTVAVAASMMPALESLRPAFRAETGAELILVPGSSGKLAAQIRMGAPFDVFVSADSAFPAALHEGGFVEGEPVLYAYGSLVLWTLKDLDVTKGLALVDGAKKIALADPKTAPYGRAAVAALKAGRVWKAAEPKLVYGESIAQVGQFITTKAADFGITAKSTVLAPGTRGRGRWSDLDAALYEPIGQSLVVLKRGAARDSPLCGRFVDFMTGRAARKILAELGYRAPSHDGKFVK